MRLVKSYIFVWYLLPLEVCVTLLIPNPEVPFVPQPSTQPDAPHWLNPRVSRSKMPTPLDNAMKSKVRNLVPECRNRLCKLTNGVTECFARCGTPSCIVYKVTGLTNRWLQLSAGS